MSQDVSVSMDGPLDLDGTTLRKVADIPYVILLRELDKVVEAATTTTQPLAGFNSRLRSEGSSPEPAAQRAIGSRTTTDTATSREK